MALFAAFFLLVLTGVSLRAQASSGERIFFNAKVFTGNPESPYAEAVAIRGDKIVAVGSLAEVLKTASKNAERVDLEGKSLFPGFIDSHTHSIDGGLGLIGADASEKVETIEQLAPFVDAAKKSGKGMRGDVLEIYGMPLEFLVADRRAQRPVQHRGLREAIRPAARHGWAHRLGESRAVATRRHHS